MRQRTTPSTADLIGLGMLLATSVVAPLLGGLWLDGRLGTSPAGVLVGLLLGIVAAVVTVFVRFKRYL